MGVIETTNWEQLVEGSFEEYGGVQFIVNPTVKELTAFARKQSRLGKGVEVKGLAVDDDSLLFWPAYHLTHLQAAELTGGDPRNAIAVMTKPGGISIWNTSAAERHPRMKRLLRQAGQEPLAVAERRETLPVEVGGGMATVTDVEVLVNPSRREVRGLVNKAKRGELRGLMYEGDVYVWDAYHAEHSSVLSALGASFGADSDGWPQFMVVAGERAGKDVPVIVHGNNTSGPEDAERLAKRWGAYGPVDYWDYVKLRRRVESVQWADSVSDLDERYGGAAQERSIWYHGTKTENLRSILSQGLVPDGTKKAWAGDPNRSLLQPDRSSYGGIYVTRNLMTALSSIRHGTYRDEDESRGVIVVMELQPRSFLADEDELTLPLATGFDAKATVAGGNPESRGAAMWFAKEAEQTVTTRKMLEASLDQFRDTAVRVIDRKSDLTAAEAQELVQRVGDAKIREAWEASLGRAAAYYAKRSKPYDVRRAALYAIDASDGELDQLMGRVPPVQEAESRFRRAVDKLTRSFKVLARKQDDFSPTARLTAPVRLGRGSNKVVAVAELVPKDDKPRQNAVRVVYGKLPQDFKQQWKQRVGDLEIVESALVHWADSVSALDERREGVTLPTDATTSPGKTIPVLINPTRREVLGALKKSKYQQVRGAVSSGGDVAVWDAEAAIHTDMAKTLWDEHASSFNDHGFFIESIPGKPGRYMLTSTARPVTDNPHIARWFDEKNDLNNVRYINEGVSDTEDSGAGGKSYELAFAKCMDLAGIAYEENGLRGKGGALWDFKPRGIQWKRLPDGSPVNLKTATARTLFTSTDVWRKLFDRDMTGEPEDRVERIVKQALGRMGFPDVYWLKAKDKAVEREVRDAAASGDPQRAIAVLAEKNWSYHKLGRYSVEFEWDEQSAHIRKIRILDGGKRFANIRVRHNAAAGNTAGWARTTSGKPKPPFRELILEPEVG